MVPRPEGRDAPDWARIHFSIAPVYYHNYLLGELTASQLRHYLDNQVLGGGTDVGRRFVSDPAVGQYLVERVFQPGATRHWRSTLERATGRPCSPGTSSARPGRGSDRGDLMRH